MPLHIPEPCHQSWDGMTPAEGGRHCASCDKVVRDFTAMTVPQILDTLRAAPGRVCGRLRASQLAPPPARLNPWRQAFLAAVFLVFLAGGAQAQTVPKPNSTTESEESMLKIIVHVTNEAEKSEEFAQVILFINGEPVKGFKTGPSGQDTILLSAIFLKEENFELRVVTLEGDSRQLSNIPLKSSYSYRPLLVEVAVKQGDQVLNSFEDEEYLGIILSDFSNQYNGSIYPYRRDPVTGRFIPE